MKTPTSLSIILAFLFTLHLPLTSFDKGKLDSLFTFIEENDKSMGSISLFKNGVEIYQNSIGFADIENKNKADQNTKYRIGSISKSFTAVIIMQMIEEGKLTLETNLSDFFPEIPNSQKITIENLLRHSSGLYNFTNSEDYSKWMEEYKSREEMIELFKENGTVYSPGEKNQYSNTNYVLLSYIAEDIDNKNFKQVLNDRIIQKCSLKNTYLGGKINTNKGESKSYYKISKSWKEATETDISIPMGAGGISSTPTDLNKFYSILFTGDLIEKETLSKMIELKNNFGIGLFPIPFYEKTAFGHTGGIDGFISSAGYFPEDSISISYISNGVDMDINSIMLGALNIYFNKEFELPEFKPVIEVSSKELDKYLGTYSSADFPLKIKISKIDNTLLGQATGQPEFPLEAFEKHKFKYDRALLELEFIPSENKMILKQNGAKYTLSKE